MSTLSAIGPIMSSLVGLERTERRESINGEQLNANIKERDPVTMAASGKKKKSRSYRESKSQYNTCIYLYYRNA